MPVRARRDADEQRAHALLEVLGDAVLERVGLLVHLVPRDAEDLHEERLDQAVARDDAAAERLALLGEREALALVAHDQAVVDEAPHHLERGRLRDAHRTREVGLRGVDAGLVHPEELLEVLLDGRCERLHATSLPAARSARTGRRAIVVAVAGRPLITARRRAAAVLALAAAAVALLAAAPRPAKQRAGGARLDDVGQQPGAAVARRHLAADHRQRVQAEARLVAPDRRHGSGAAALPDAHRGRRQAPRHLRHGEPSRAASRRSTRRPGSRSGRASSARSSTGCAQMPKGVFGVTGTPVYDPVGRLPSTSPPPTSCGRSTCTAASRGRGWPILLPIDQFHEHVWGAIALANDHVYLGLASYCDRRPYSGRVLSVVTTTAAVDHQWVVVNTVGGDPGGGGIWGWGGIAITADGHVWAASANANTAEGDPENLDHAESVIELTSSLGLLASSHAPGMPTKGDFGFGSTPIVFKAGALRHARGLRGQGRRALPVVAPQARGRPGAAPRAGLPGDALRLARVGPADPAALRHDLAGLRRHAGRPRRARASRRAASCASPGTASSAAS